MKKIAEIIDEVCEELFSLDDDEFMQMLEKNKDGDITKALMELDSLSVGDLQADFTEKYYEANTYYSEWPSLNIDMNMLNISDFLSFHPNDPGFENLYENKYFHFYNTAEFEQGFESVLDEDTAFVNTDQIKYKSIGELNTFEGEELWAKAA